MTTIYKLHESSIKTIPTDAKEVSFENEGLYGYVTKTGSIVIRYRYSVNKGPRRKFKIGSYPENTIKELSTAYKKAVGKVALGEDPQGERVELAERQIEQSEIMTVAQIGQEFVDWSKKNKKSWSEDQRIYKTEILKSPIAHRPVTEVKYEDVAELLIEITNRPAPVMANRVKSWISKCLRIAKQQNPRKLKKLYVAPIIFDLATNKEKERKRILSDTELRKFWHAIDNTTQNESQRSAVKLQLLTGQRLAEIVTLHSDYIEGNWWTIPDTKNGTAHRVFLNNMALEYVGVEGWVFPGRGTDHVHESTHSHLVPKVAKAAGIKHCTSHDLRRTLATFVQSKFKSEVKNRVINHSQGSKNERTYGLYDFDPEKELAMKAWEQKLNRVLGQPIDNVIHLSA